MSTNNGNGNRAAAYRRSQNKEVTMPSGATVLMRTAPLQAWWADGRIPQSFTATAIRAQAAANPNQMGAQLLAEETAEDRTELMKFMVTAIRYAFVSPKIVDAPGEDEDAITIEDLSVDDFNFAFLYATGQAPSQTITTRQGEVTVDAVADFHPGGLNESSVIVGDGLPEIQQATV